MKPLFLKQRTSPEFSHPQLSRLSHSKANCALGRMLNFQDFL